MYYYCFIRINHGGPDKNDGFLAWRRGTVATFTNVFIVDRRNNKFKWEKDRENDFVSFRFGQKKVFHFGRAESKQFCFIKYFKLNDENDDNDDDLDDD